MHLPHLKCALPFPGTKELEILLEEGKIDDVVSGPSSDRSSPAAARVLEKQLLIFSVHSSHNVRKSTAKAFEKLSETTRLCSQSVEALIHLLGDNRGRVRARAVTALVNVGEDAVPQLEKAMASSDGSVGWEAARSLSMMGLPALGVFERALHNENPALRWRVVAALRNAGQEAVPLLTRALRDKNSAVRDEAAASLGCMGAPAVNVLVQALKDLDSDVRRRAVAELEGKKDLEELDLLPMVIPAAIQALQDSDAEVRRRATNILQKHRKNLSSDDQLKVKDMLTRAVDKEDDLWVKIAIKEAVKSFQELSTAQQAS